MSMATFKFSIVRFYISLTIFIRIHLCTDRIITVRGLTLTLIVQTSANCLAIYSYNGFLPRMILYFYTDIITWSILCFYKFVNVEGRDSTRNIYNTREITFGSASHRVRAMDSGDLNRTSFLRSHAISSVLP